MITGPARCGCALETQRRQIELVDKHIHDPDRAVLGNVIIDVKQKYASASYNGGVNFTPDMINSIPVPSGMKKAAIAGLVDIILIGRSKYVEATASLHSLLRASGGAAKLGRKLDAWHQLSSAEFIAEIAKRGVCVPVAERPQWVDVFARHKASVAKVLTSAEAAYVEIDDTLATAFGLSQADRNLVGL